jgi:GT2 family glycosyltransferase
MHKNVAVYTVVVTYNGIRWIQRCLACLKKSDIDLHIIIVDNGSTDGTIECIRESYPDVILILNSENKGFGKANNQGIKIGLEKGADYVFLLNQDAWIDDNTIEHLVRLSCMHTEYGVLSPVHLNGDGTDLEYTFAYFANSRSCRNFFSDLYLKKELREIYTIDFVSAAAWLLSRRCIERIGGFDPIYHHYCEDNDFVMRMKYHGFKLGICPGVKIYHDQQLSSYEKPVELELNPERKYARVLLSLKNLNIPFPRKFLSEVAGLLRNIVLCVLRGAMVHAVSYSRVLGKIILNNAGIRKSRMLSKRGGMIFLD